MGKHGLAAQWQWWSGRLACAQGVLLVRLAH